MTFSRSNQQLLELNHGLLTEFSNFKVFKQHEPLVHQLRLFQPGLHILIQGDPGSGCSHLAKATCLYHSDLKSIYLPIADLKHLSKSMLEGLNHIDLICVEDIHKLSQSREQQILLFDLINVTLHHGLRLLITSHLRPDIMYDWLPDLRTRLQAMCNWHLPNLTDTEKLSIIISWIEQQNIFLDEEVVDFIFKYKTRDLQQSKNIIEKFLKYCMRVKKNANINSLRGFLG
tara:strand:+ start:174 stop:863 length:690 start_codon:yes stop_codon:yes gene_type:complete